MRIGIDIDGVLTDIETFEFENGSKYFKKPIINPKGYSSKNIFEVSDDEDDEFWSKAIYDYINVDARNYASEVIKKLKDDGNEIYIITNRTSELSYCDISEEQMKQHVINWLNKNNIYYDKLIFSDGTKEKYILDNKIDIMIEDKPKNIMKLSQYIKVICFDNRSNKNCIGDNIIHCYSWYDIYNIIKNGIINL